MIVSLPTEKFNEITALLKNWHSHRKSFVIKEAATLLGKLENAATICTWARFLLLSLRHAILLALRASRKRVHNCKQFRHFIADADALPTDDFGLLRKKIAYGLYRRSEERR